MTGTKENERQVAKQQFGFRFQVYAGLYLVLKYIDRLVSVEFESNLEDVKIKLQNKQVLYIQVKNHYHTNPDEAENKNAKTTLKSALEGLFVTFNAVKTDESDTNEFHYVFNFSNPFGKGRSKKDKESFAYLVGGYRDSPQLRYDELTRAQQKQVDEVIGTADEKNNIIWTENELDFRNHLFFKRFQFARFVDDHEQMRDLIRRVEKFQQINRLDLPNTDEVVMLILAMGQENMGKENIEITREQFLVYFLIADSMARSEMTTLGRKKSRTKLEDRDYFYKSFLRWVSENVKFIQGLNAEFADWANENDISFVNFENYDEDEDEIITFLNDRGANLVLMLENIVPDWKTKTAEFQAKSLSENDFVKAAVEKYIQSVGTITQLMEGELRGVD